MWILERELMSKLIGNLARKSESGQSIFQQLVAKDRSITAKLRTLAVGSPEARRLFSTRAEIRARLVAGLRSEMLRIEGRSFHRGVA